MPHTRQTPYAAHTADTRLHLAFSSWLFNAKGQLLVTRRALSKKAWPGVWTNSVCGHPQLGESNEDAVIRRCRYELGVEITPPESIYPDFRYRATDPNGILAWKLRLLNLSILTFATAPPIRVALWKMKCVRYLPHAPPVRYRSTMMK